MVLWRVFAVIVLLSSHWKDVAANPIGNSIGGSQSMMPIVKETEVKCGRVGMNVHITFDRPFPGVIYSKGYFNEPKCNYVSVENASENVYSFQIPIDACGTTGHRDDPTPAKDMYFENTIIIQNDPLIQEVWDTAKRLRCSWPHTISKSVETKPFKVQAPELVNIDFDSRSVNTLMQIQQGRSPFTSPATGYIYVGDDTSVVIYVQDSSGDLDANAVSCKVSSSKGQAIDIIDNNGCLLRPDLMTPFGKLRNPQGVEADLMLYSYFKAFSVGDNPDFKITCQLEVCEGACLEPCALGVIQGKRKRRQASTQLIELEQGAILITRDNEGEDSRQCSLSSVIATAVILLVGISALLFCLSCYLSLKLYSLNKS